MAKFAPNTQLSASTDVWGPYYIKRIQDVLAGTWKSTDTWGGFEAACWRCRRSTNMPDDVAALATQTVADITDRQEQGVRRPAEGSEPAR